MMRIVVAEPRTAAAVERMVIILMAKDLLDAGIDVRRDDLVALALLKKRWRPTDVALHMDAAIAEVGRLDQPVNIARFFKIADACDVVLGAS